jgi:hypothetical protein
VGDTVRLAVTEPDSEAVVLRDVDGLALDEDARDVVPVDERVSEAVAEKERLALAVELGGPLGLATPLGDTDGDTLALASHWQQARWLTLQSSSATAPLAKAPGARTLMHVPAPVGAAWPAVGVPHQLPFVA